VLGALKSWAASRPQDAELLWVWAESAQAAGLRDTALEALDFARSLPLDPAQACRAAVLYAGMGEPGRAGDMLRDMFAPGRRDISAAKVRRALGTLQRWVALHPRDAALLLAWADGAKAAGLRERAWEALGSMPAARLDGEQTRRAAALYRGLDRPRQARAMLRRLMAPPQARRLRDAGLLLGLADEAVRVRDRGFALWCLAKAARLGLRPEESGRVAVLYQDLGEYSRALGILDELVRAEPKQARWRSDRGVLAMLMGMRDRAREDWEQTIALDQDFLPAYLSLGSLQAASGRRAEALALYERALRRPSGGPDQKDIRERIRLEHERLLGGRRRH
jgi:tetratricopeptide (TPR) repeat protein